MTATGFHSFLDTLAPVHRERLMELAREVSFPAGARIFNEGRRADRFWVLCSGGVELDVAVPGGRSVVVQTLGAGDLLGWSWMYAPHLWHLGARARTPVRALEFPAEPVLRMCEADPVLGRALAQRCAEVIGERLRATRIRLLDVYGPGRTGSV